MATQSAQTSWFREIVSGFPAAFTAELVGKGLFKKDGEKIQVHPDVIDAIKRSGSDFLGWTLKDEAIASAIIAKLDAKNWQLFADWVAGPDIERWQMKDFRIVLAYLNSLPEFGEERALMLLNKLLDIPDPEVRTLVAQEMGLCGTKEPFFANFPDKIMAWRQDAQKAVHHFTASVDDFTKRSQQRVTARKATITLRKQNRR